MGLRKPTKYQLKLFAPFVVLIWLLLIVTGLWMYNTERQLRDNYTQSTPIEASSTIVNDDTPAEVSDRKLLKSVYYKTLNTSGRIYLALVGLALIGTAFAWFMARRLGQNIEALRDFAQRATSEDFEIVPSIKPGPDALGEITNHIVSIYNQRSAAVIKLKREHKVAYHALEDKTRIKREITNNINHELKTPIAVIKGYIDTINEHPDMDEDSRRHFLKKVSEHVDRLTRMLDALSSITRLEYGAQMINTEPINFHEIVFKLVNECETSGVLGDMTFNYDIPVYCSVIGNHTLLTGMLNNLVKNAIAYSKGTEINLILTEKDNEFYHFAFYDNGVGVKPESIPHLFDRFFREDSGRSRKNGGTGLGLAVVKNTIDALGGTISVDNRSGGGLIYRFALRQATKKD